MKVKRIFGLLTLACSLFMATQVSAEEKIEFRAGNVMDVDLNEVDSVKSGDTVCVPLYIDNAPPILDTMQYYLGYDSEKFEFIMGENNVTQKNKLGKEVIVGSIQENTVLLNGQSTVMVGWSGGADQVDLTNNTKPVYLAYFTALGDADVNADVSFEVVQLDEFGYVISGIETKNYAEEVVLGGSTTVLNKASILTFEIAKNPGYWVHEVYLDLDGSPSENLTKCTETETGYEFKVNIRNSGDANKDVKSVKIMVRVTDTEDGTDLKDVVYTDFGAFVVEKF